MNAVMHAKDHYTAEFERLAADLAGHGAQWLRELRANAIARFAEGGFPTPRDEDWKYTRTAAIEKRGFSCAIAGEAAVDMARIEALLQVESAGPCRAAMRCPTG
jgi:Fe-S cluster assembly protein SufD